MDRILVTRLLATTASIAWLAVNAPVHAQSPQVPTVAAGSIAVTRQGATTVVNQKTDRGIVDWRSFSIGAGEAVRFDQPGRASVTLNRVTGSEVSRIDGNLSANGQVWLANPNGVMIGPGGQVNVGGLLATTGRVDAAEFLKSGRAAIDQIGKGASVANLGTVNIAEGGYAALAAASIRNEGLVAARKGSVAMGAGKAVTVDFIGDKLITFQVTEPLDQAGSGDGMISAGGKITADGGAVLLSARAAKGVMDNVINLNGHVVANSVKVDGGTVSFGDGGIVRVSGKIDASSSVGKGGGVAILGEKVGLMDGASIDASGAQGGGTVLVGGDWQGKGPAHNAAVAYVARTASINVDATMAGEGGKAVVWADDSTRFNGTISARGGVLSGDGGQVETSGKRALNVGDAAVVTTASRAASGKAGAWLLDPNDIEIKVNGGDNITQSSAFQAVKVGSSSVSPNTLSEALKTGDVIVQTSAGTGGNGNITFSGGSITTSIETARTVTLKADGDITINGGKIELTGAAHNIILHSAAGATITTQGQVSGNISLSGATLTTTGGNIDFRAGATGSLAPQATVNMSGVKIGQFSLLDAGAGVISISGATRSTTGVTHGVEISGASKLASSGGITIKGYGNSSVAESGDGVFIDGASLKTTGLGTITIIGDRRSGKGRNVAFTGGASIESANGAITITGTETTGGAVAAAYGVSLASNSMISTVDGPIAIHGSSAVNSTQDSDGVLIAGAIKASGTGSITILGARGGYVSGVPSSEAVNIAFGGLVQTNSGSISLTGTNSLGGGDNAVGVLIQSRAEVISASGDIKISGVGASAGTSGAYGVKIEGTVTVAEAGAITIIGNGGAGTGSKNAGVLVQGAAKIGSGGAITITGKGGGDLGLGLQSDGFVFVSGAIEATGSGSITIDGERGQGDNAQNMTLGSGSLIKSVGGDINLIGSVTNGYSILGLSADASGGITLSGTVQTQDGKISIDGSGAPNGDTSFGVSIGSTSSTIATGAGSIAIRGIASPSKQGIVAGASALATHLQTNTGDITLTATGISWAPTQPGGIKSLSGIVKILPMTATTRIGVGSGTGDLQASASLLNAIDGKIEIGRPDLSAAITVGANLIAPGNLTLRSGSGAINFQGAVNAATAGAQSLSVATSSGTVTFSGTVGGSTAFSTIDILGPAIFYGGWPVKSIGTQSYAGATVVAATGSFSTTNSNIFFGSTVDGFEGFGSMAFALGTGTASFSGAVGATTSALGSLAIGNAAFGGDVITTQQQSYGGAVTLNGVNTTLSSKKSSITLGPDTVFSYTNAGAGSLSLLAGTDIKINSATIKSATAALDVTLNAGATGTDQASVGGGIEIKTGTIETKGGVLTMVGGIGGAFAAMGRADMGGRGVNVTGTSKLDLGAGALIARGRGRDGVAGGRVEGVALNDAIVTANGGVTLEGQSGDGAIDIGNRGVGIENTSLDVATGKVTITGVGGGAKGFAFGVFLGAGTLNLGTGMASITGYGATDGSATENHGVMISGATLNSSGSLTIHGTGGGTGVGFSKANAGIQMNSGAIVSSGTGSVTLIGQRGLGADSVNINLSGGGISTRSGALTLTGSSSTGGGNSSGNLLNSTGVVIGNASTLKTVDGLISVTGTGAAIDGQGADGLRLLGRIQATGNGEISLTGTRGGVTAGGTPTGNDNIQIATAALVSTNTGKITITATESGGTGASDNGFLSAGTVSSSGGDIFISGVGAALGTTSRGVQHTGTVSTTGAGAITVVGRSDGGDFAFYNAMGRFKTDGGPLTLKGANYFGDGLTAGGGVILRQALTPSGPLTVSAAPGGELAGFETAATVIVGETGMTGDINVVTANFSSLRNDTTFLTKSGAINFLGALDANGDGVQSLKIQSISGVTSFGGSLGASKPFKSIDVTGPVVSSAPVIRTTGAQSYGGAAQIASGVATVFSTTDAPLTFGSTVDGPGSLETKIGTGALSFTGAVGGTTPLGGFSTSGGLTLGAGLTTVGDQSYGGLVSLTGTSSQLKSTSGAIKIGAGGVLSYTNASAGTLSLVADTDILIDGGVIRSTSGAVGVTLNSGASGTTQAQVGGGVLLKSAIIQTAGGAVAIVGGENGTLAATGGTVFPDFGLSKRDGVLLMDSKIEAGAGSIQVRGTARNSDFVSGHGVEVNNTTLAGQGGITVTGLGSGLATAEANGINIVANAKLDGGTGGVNLTGTGGVGAALVSGIVINSSKISASGFGVVTVTGFKGSGGGAGSSLSMSDSTLSTAGGVLTVKASEQAVSGASKIDAGIGGVALRSSAVTSALKVSAGALSAINATGLIVGEIGQSANIDFAADTVLKQNMTVISGAGAINFAGALDASVAGGQNLKIQSTSGMTSFGGSVGGGLAFSTIDVAGPMSSSAAKIKTTGTQSYGGAAQIASGATTIFTTNAAAVSFGGALNGPGGVGFSVGTSTVSLTGGAGTSAALGGLSVDNAALGGLIVTSGAQSYGAVTLLSATELSTTEAAPITFGGNVTGTHALTLNNAGGATSFTAGAGTLASLSHLGGGALTLGGGISTTGAQTYSGPVTLTADVTLATAANAITVAGEVNAADTPVALTLATSGGAVSLGAGAGATTTLASLSLTGGGAATLGGQFKTTGAQSYSGGIDLAADATFGTDSAAVIFNGIVQSGTGKSLTVLAGTGGVAFANGAGSAGPLGGVTIDAPLSLSGTITSTGAQTYGGVISLTGDSGFKAAGQSVAFKQNVSGPYNLKVNAKSIELGDVAPVTITTTGTGNQFYSGAISLANDATLGASGMLSLNDTVNGAKNLTVKGSLVNLGSKIGGVTPLGSLAAATTGGLISIAGDILTSGSQSYANGVGLTNDVLLSSAKANVSFAGAVGSSGKSLTVTVSDPTGEIGFGGALDGMNSVLFSLSGMNVSLPSITAKNITVTAGGGAVSQATAANLKISGNTSINASAGISLANTGNDFGEVALTTKGLATIADVNGLVLSSSSVSGSLTVSTGGPVTQSGALSTAGLLLQGSGTSYMLNDIGNAISTLAVKLGGGSISLANGDAVSLTVGTVAGISGVTGVNSLAINQMGSDKAITLQAPVNVGTGSANLSAVGVINGAGAITASTGATLTLAVGGSGSAISTDANVKTKVTAGVVSINGVLFDASGAVPVVIPNVPNVPTDSVVVNVPSQATTVNVPSQATTASVPSQATTASMPSEASQVSQVTLASTPTVAAVPAELKPVLAQTTPIMIANEKIEDVVGKLIVSILPSIPSASQTLSSLVPEQDSGTAAVQQSDTSSQAPASGSTADRGNAETKGSESAAQRQINVVNATPIGALIPRSPSAVQATGAPLASARTIKLDPADTGGANGQVIARTDSIAGGVANQASGTTAIVPGLLVQAPRPASARAEPPLAQQPSTLNEESFLD